MCSSYTQQSGTADCSLGAVDSSGWMEPVSIMAIVGSRLRACDEPQCFMDVEAQDLLTLVQLLQQCKSYSQECRDKLLGMQYGHTTTSCILSTSAVQVADG